MGHSVTENWVIPTCKSTPMPTHGSFQLIEAVFERLDSAPVGKRCRWSDDFKAKAVAATMGPDGNVSALAPKALMRCTYNNGPHSAAHF